MAQLFDPGPAPTAVVPEVSKDVRRRLRQEAMIQQGYHPLTRRPLLDGENGRARCNDCRFAFVHERRSRRYYKCEKVGMTFGPGTDLKLKWPACELFKRREI